MDCNFEGLHLETLSLALGGFPGSLRQEMDWWVIVCLFRSFRTSRSGRENGIYREKPSKWVAAIHPWQGWWLVGGWTSTLYILGIFGDYFIVQEWWIWFLTINQPGFSMESAWSSILAQLLKWWATQVLGYSGFPDEPLFYHRWVGRCATLRFLYTFSLQVVRDIYCVLAVWRGHCWYFCSPSGHFQRGCSSEPTLIQFFQFWGL